MFLVEVYKRNFSIFLLFCAFILLQLFVTIKHVEITPFFLWGHYSAEMRTRGTYQKIIIKINGADFDYTRLPFFTREMITLPVFQYYNLKNDPHFPDSYLHSILKEKLNPKIYNYAYSRLINTSEKISLFPFWLRKYIELVTHSKINSLEVALVEMQVDNDIFLTSSKILIQL